MKVDSIKPFIFKKLKPEFGPRKALRDAVRIASDYSGEGSVATQWIQWRIRVCKEIERMKN